MVGTINSSPRLLEQPFERVKLYVQSKHYVELSLYRKNTSRYKLFASYIFAQKRFLDSGLNIFFVRFFSLSLKRCLQCNSASPCSVNDVTEIDLAGEGAVNGHFLLFVSVSDSGVCDSSSNVAGYASACQMEEQFDR